MTKQARYEMAGFTDALRGYAYPFHKRDGFRCRYCGLDGTGPLPTGFPCPAIISYPRVIRDDPEYIVTACMFCNTPDNATST